MTKPLAVFVDGVNKGEVYKRKGRWIWLRGGTATETFHKKAILEDVAEWARKCCNGKVAQVKPTEAHRAL